MPTLNSRSNMSDQIGSRLFGSSVRDAFEMSDDFEVAHGPGMPCLVPGAVELRCEVVATKNIWDITLEQD
jgi:hypothetical protein